MDTEKHLSFRIQAAIKATRDEAQEIEERYEAAFRKSGRAQQDYRAIQQALRRMGDAAPQLLRSEEVICKDVALATMEELKQAKAERTKVAALKEEAQRTEEAANLHGLIDTGHSFAEARRRALRALYASHRRRCLARARGELLMGSASAPRTSRTG
jgi:hypothetical protein